MDQGPCNVEQSEGSTAHGPRPSAQGPGLVIQQPVCINELVGLGGSAGWLRRVRLGLGYA